MASPTARHSLLAIGSSLLVLLGANAVVAGVAWLALGEQAELSRLTPPGLIAQGLAMLAWIGWLATRTSDGWRVTLAWRWPRRLWVVLGIVPTGLVADRVVTLLAHLAPGMDQGSLGLLQGALLEHPVMMGLGAVLMAPLTEELLFRGYAWRGLERSAGSAVALVTSALLFGLFHGDPLQAVGTFVIGLYLGLVRWSTGSVLACVLAHALNNGLWLAAGLWGDRIGL